MLLEYSNIFVLNFKINYYSTFLLFWWKNFSISHSLQEEVLIIWPVKLIFQHFLLNKTCTLTRGLSLHSFPGLAQLRLVATPFPSLPPVCCLLFCFIPVLLDGNSVPPVITQLKEFPPSSKSLYHQWLLMILRIYKICTCTFVFYIVQVLSLSVI